MTRTLSSAWACPDARLLLPLSASRAQWLAGRRVGVGGSEVGALVGINPYRTPYDVWLDKMGRSPERAPTRRMLRGTAMEPLIAAEFGDDTGLEFRRAGLMRSKTYPHLIGNVDRLASDGGGVEIKRTDSYAISKKVLGGAPPRYWLWQCLTYLAVTGRTHWWLVAMLPMRDELWVQRLDAEDYRADISGIGPLVEQWWDRHVSGASPPATGAPYLEQATGTASRVEAVFPDRVLADAARWEELREISAEADVEIDQIRARLALELRDAAQLTVEQRPVARWVHRRGASTFDRKRLRTELPDIEAAYSVTGEPTRYVTLIPSTGEPR